MKDVSNKYYAMFSESGYNELAEFPTKKLRDEWVNFQDEFSQICELDKDNAFLQRKPADDLELIRKILNDKKYYTEIDHNLTYITWYIRNDV